MPGEISVACSEHEEQVIALFDRASGPPPALRALHRSGPRRRRGDYPGGISCSLSAFAAGALSAQPARLAFSGGSQSVAEATVREINDAEMQSGWTAACAEFHLDSRPNPEEQASFSQRQTRPAGSAARPACPGPALPSTARRRAAISRDCRSAWDVAGQHIGVAGSVAGAPGTRRRKVNLWRNAYTHLTDEELLRFADGELSPRQLAGVNTHLDLMLGLPNAPAAARRHHRRFCARSSRHPRSSVAAQCGTAGAAQGATDGVRGLRSPGKLAPVVPAGLRFAKTCLPGSVASGCGFGDGHRILFRPPPPEAGRSALFLTLG